MKKAIWSILGFLFFTTGFTALCLMLVGVQYQWLAWLDAPGRLFGFVMRLLFIIGGIIMVYLVNSDFRGEGRV